MKCIANGAVFVHPDSGAWVVGDLYADEWHTTWVFHANVNKDNSPAWLEAGVMRELTFTSRDWWERRGVFIFPGEVDASRALVDYITDGAS